MHNYKHFHAFYCIRTQTHNHFINTISLLQYYASQNFLVLLDHRLEVVVVILSEALDVCIIMYLCMYVCAYVCRW